MFLAWLTVSLCLMQSNPGAALAKAQNLLPNPSFEGEDALIHWERLAWPGASLTQDETVSHIGASSCSISANQEAEAQYPAFKSPMIPARPDEEYAGSVWARTQGATGIAGYVVLEFYRGTERLSFAQGDFTGSGEQSWKLLSVRASVPDGSDGIKLGLVFHGQGQVWFDEASLIRVCEAPAPLKGSRVSLKVKAKPVITERFLGFGAQGDFFLTCDFNALHGVTDQDVSLVLDRVKTIGPHIIRIFFAYGWWEPEEGRQTPDSAWVKDIVFWAKFLKSIDCNILLTPWGDCFAYSPWMAPDKGRLPALDKREAMIRSLVDFVAFLREDQGLDNVRYLCLMNEPDNDPMRPVEVEEFMRLNRMLDQSLQDRGLRQDVFLLGMDDCSGGPCEASPWFRGVASQKEDVWDGISVHTYRHEHVPSLRPWLQDRRQILDEAGRGRPGQPILITEFGYGGDVNKNSENHKFEYGLFLADFAVTALDQGASACLMWCLFDTYYNETFKQEYGLWKHKEEGWAPRPGFYAWSLMTRYTQPESRVLSVSVEPKAPRLRAVALQSHQGQVTLLVVNRYDKALEVHVDRILGRSSMLRVFRYDQAEPFPETGMIQSSECLDLCRGRASLLHIAPRSFVLLTEVE